MKLNELDNKYEIFVDLDGVLVDFETKAAEMLGMKKNDFPDANRPKDNAFDEKLWGGVRKLHAEGKPFWGDMPELPDARELWNYIKNHHPEILTATGKEFFSYGAKEKKDWVSEFCGASTKTNVVKNSPDKARLAGPNKILIDDRHKSLKPWKEAGGIGILHTSAKNTIKKLKELGL